MNAAASTPTPTFLTAKWHHLAMLNYPIDPDILRPLVPRGTELDLFNDTALVSMVGFRFLDTRVKGIPIPFHRDFEEVNLRFYVRRDHPDGPRRGVVFVRELVPRWAIAFVARTIYQEPYLAVPMDHTIELDEAGRGEVAYRWRFQDRWHQLALKTSSPAALPEPGSEAEFITEHYWGYTAQRDGSTREYQVQHPTWQLLPASDPQLDCDVAALYGPAFANPLSQPPTSTFLAIGSPISVHQGRPI